MNWRSFTLGVVIGTILSLTAINFIGNRYRITTSGPAGLMSVKLDSWTGQSWMMRFYEQDGNKVWYWSEIEEK